MVHLVPDNSTTGNHPLIGRKGVVKRKIKKKDLRLFRRISHDDNRLHFDKDYAKTTSFKKPIAHGFLTTSLISGAVGAKLFREDILYKTQSFHFLKPVYIGDTITATAEVVDVDGKLLTLSTYCQNQKGEYVVQGEGVIILKNMEKYVD